MRSFISHSPVRSDAITFFTISGPMWFVHSFRSGFVLCNTSSPSLPTMMGEERSACTLASRKGPTFMHPNHKRRNGFSLGRNDLGSPKPKPGLGNHLARTRVCDGGRVAKPSTLNPQRMRKPVRCYAPQLVMPYQNMLDAQCHDRRRTSSMA